MSQYPIINNQTEKFGSWNLVIGDYLAIVSWSFLVISHVTTLLYQKSLFLWQCQIKTQVASF